MKFDMKTAMIFAAGRGERLRPLTDLIPKALCKVSGIPLIERHVRNLATAGFERVVINHAHLGGQIRRHFDQCGSFGLEILYSPEPPGALETGGALVNALPLLGSSAFITVNADILTNYNFNNLLLPQNSSAHIVLIKTHDPMLADFSLAHNGVVQNNPRNLIFTGIACYQANLFKDHHPGRYSVAPKLRELAALKQLTGECFLGSWADLGTFKDLRGSSAYL